MLSPRSPCLLPWGQTFSSVLPSPLYTPLFNQARPLFHPGESEASSTHAQGRPMTLHHHLLPSSLSHPLPYSPAPSMCIPENAGPQRRGKAQVWFRDEIWKLCDSITAHVDSRCQEQKWEQGSGITSEMRDGTGKDVSALNLFQHFVYMSAYICENYGTLYLRCIYFMYRIILQWSESISCSVLSDYLQPHGLYVAHQALLSMGFSRHGLPVPSP